MKPFSLEVSDPSRRTESAFSTFLIASAMFRRNRADTVKLCTGNT